VILSHSPGAAAWSNPFKKKEGFEITVTAPFVELRTGPGRGYPITHIAERGENIRVFKRLTDWYKVETQKGVIGWIKNDELNDSLTEDGYLAVFSKPAREEYESRKWELGMALSLIHISEPPTPY